MDTQGITGHEYGFRKIQVCYRLPVDPDFRLDNMEKGISIAVGMQDLTIKAAFPPPVSYRFRHTLVWVEGSEMSLGSCHWCCTCGW